MFSSFHCKTFFARGVYASLIVIGLPALTGCVHRTESDVVVYASTDQEFSMPIIKGFERSKGAQNADTPAADTATSDESTPEDPTDGSHTRVVCKFDIESTKTVGLVNELIAESARPVCDVFWNNEVLHTIRLQKLGLLEPHDWKIDASFPAELRADDGTWCGFAARARILMVNTDLLPDPKDWPQSVDELGDPKWADRCAMSRPLAGTAATHFAVLASVYGHEATLGKLKQIQSNARVLSGNKQVALSVSGGQVAWGLTDTDDAIVEKDEGYPVAIVFPDQQPDQPGVLRIPNTAMILKNAPHPIAAKRFVDYLVTPAIEDRLAMGNSSQIPLHRGSKFPPRVLPPEPVRWMRSDFTKAAEEWPQWASKVNQLFE
jgi:iron(III) transport system substrate-binding protein